MTRRLSRSTLFPYTTLFRSQVGADQVVPGLVGQLVQPPARDVRAGRDDQRVDVPERRGEGVERVAVGEVEPVGRDPVEVDVPDRKSTRLNSSHSSISYAVFC